MCALYSDCIDVTLKKTVLVVLLIKCSVVILCVVIPYIFYFSMLYGYVICVVFCFGIIAMHINILCSSFCKIFVLLFVVIVIVALSSFVV